MKKLEDLPPGALFRRREGRGGDGALLLKIQPLGVSGGDPWAPGKHDKRYTAVLLDGGVLVAIPEEEMVIAVESGIVVSATAK